MYKTVLQPPLFMGNKDNYKIKSLHEAAYIIFSITFDFLNVFYLIVTAQLSVFLVL